MGKTPRGVLIVFAMILCLQLAVAYLIGLGYQSETQYASARGDAQVNSQVREVRATQLQLTRQLAQSLGVAPAAIHYTAQSGTTNNRLGTASGCPLGSAVYGDSYSFAYPGDPTAVSDAARADRITAATKRTVSRVLAQLGTYSLNDPDNPTTINVQGLQTQFSILGGYTVQVYATIKTGNQATDPPRCFPLAQLPYSKPSVVPSVTPSPTYTYSGNTGAAE